MAFGRDQDQDRKDADAMRRKRGKQREYQERYRKKLVVLGIPERDDYADAALVVLLDLLAEGTANGEKLRELGFGRRLFENLEMRRFNKANSEAAFHKMVARWREDLDRDERERKLEAAYQARMAGQDA